MFKSLSYLVRPLKILPLMSALALSEAKRGRSLFASAEEAPVSEKGSFMSGCRWQDINRRTAKTSNLTYFIDIYFCCGCSPDGCCAGFSGCVWAGTFISLMTDFVLVVM